MWNWISDYNYDYALATIPIQLILMAVYFLRQQVPTRQSRSFWVVMVMNLVMTIMDILSCEINEVWQEYPLSLVYMANFLYFWAFLLRGWGLFDYVAEVVNAYRRWGRYFSWGMMIPALLVCGMVLSTPWAGLIFIIDPATGYHNVGWYNAIYFSTWFYILASVGLMLYHWRTASLKLQVGIYTCNLILAVGLLVRHAFMNTLVTSFFSLMAILVIFLTSQNPDSFRDRMVDVLNKAAFAELVSDLVERNRQFCCFGLSIRSYSAFKTIYSPAVMYKSLVDIGQWLKANFPGFYVFYLGNGCMVLLNHTMDYSNVQGMAKKIEQRFAYPWGKNGGVPVPLNVTMVFVSKGILQDSVHSVDVCLEQAFAEAKRRDMTDVYVVDESLLEKIKRQEKIRALMGRALQQDSLEIYLQPIYNMQEGRITALEALARLRDEELGFIPPVEFIALAEKDGNIIELGRQIFAKTCQFVSENDLDALGIEFITVNLSPAQCLNYSLGDELESIAARYSIAMDKIRLEITESAIGDMGPLLEQMHRLKESGVSFLLDDFGAGSSNLVRVMNLPFAMVKIDMQLVWAYFRSSSNMLQHIVHLFQEEKMDIVLEGVEDKHMAQQLAPMKCKYAQGYYFSHPLPANELVDFLQEHRNADWLR